VRTGGQQMLQAAIDAEVEEFLQGHSNRKDENGNRLVVRNGRLPTRELLTGAGRLDVSQPRVRDNTPEKEKRVSFSTSILPPYLRRSKTIDDLIPWLYLKVISTGDFQEALQSLLGKNAKGVSANVAVRLKEKWGREYDEWIRRDLHDKAYVYGSSCSC
jgi:putative transposase